MNSYTIEDSYKLSPMQQGMLFDYLLTAGSGSDIQQMVCDFHEDLDVGVFKRAWKKVIERHGVFRTAFRWEGVEVPQQDVYRTVVLPWEEEDWRDLSEEEREKNLNKLLRDDRMRGFDLEKPPAFRLMLIRVGDRHYKFIWTNHHILHDGRTRFIIFREVFACYEGFLEGEEVDLELPRPYRDYIEWLGQRDDSESKSYFRELLKGFPEGSIPVGHRSDADGPALEGEKAEQEIRLDPELTSALKDLAERNGLSLSTIVLGVWGIVLSCYCGEEDVVVGEVRACRRSALDGAESMVGLFMNNLPVRVKLPHGRPLLSYLKEIRTQQISLRAHEHTPLAKVYEWAGQPSGKQMFESFVLFDNAFINSALRAQGGKWENREFRLREKANFPLVVYAWGEPEMVLRIAYDASRFDASAIVRMCGHLEAVFRKCAEEPEISVSQISILTERERQQLLVEWNNTRRDYPRDACLHEIFEKQVERTPERAAVVCEGHELSYRELNERANRLAHYLRSLHVGPGVLVGIHVERSSDMLVGVLGILKAGGAYVPLDPGYPEDRLIYMQEDAQMPVLVTQAKLLAHLPRSGARVACIDSDQAGISQESAENPASGVRGDAPAYVIYTSGSTGNPKGVIGLHRGAVNRFNWMWNTYPFGEGEVCCQKTSLSFVDSVWEIFGPLLQGVRTVIVPDEIVKDPHRLIQELAAHRVTRIVLVPSLLRTIVESDGDLARLLPDLRIWVSSGEELPVDLAERFRGRMPKGVLINLYGSSEVSADATCYEVGGENLGGSVPIGRPIDNTRVYLLDSRLRPVPIGVQGEIYIGGENLARGYFNRADLTAERFIPDPFKEGEIIYRTGDLGRYRPDGNIEYLCRSDNQVKVRGYRIEPGEIESALAECKAVKQAVVVAREVRPGDTRLVAYVTAKDGERANATELRSHLRAKLPEYMIPQHFVDLDALPLTPSGKIDRKGLVAAFRPGTVGEVEHVAPRNETEKSIAVIWQEVLGLDRVSVHDNFFEIGGHSLLAIQILSRIESTFDLEIPLRALFETPTVSGVAVTIAKKQTEMVDNEMLTQMLAELEQLSPDEVNELLALERGGEENGHG